jgi:transcriptional regulator with XRE-family HTH domain
MLIFDLFFQKNANFVEKIMESEEIKKIIKELGWTQKVLAQKAGIHPITLNRNLKQNKFSAKTLRKLLRVLSRENTLSYYNRNLLRVLNREINWDDYTTQPEPAPIMKISGRIELVGESVEIKNDQNIEKIFKKILKIKEISSSLKISNNYVFFNQSDFHCTKLYPLFNHFLKERYRWWQQEITEGEFFKELKNIFNSDLVFRQVILNPRFYGKIFFYDYNTSLPLHDKANKIGKLFTKLRDEELKKIK